MRKWKFLESRSSIEKSIPKEAIQIPYYEFKRGLKADECIICNAKPAKIKWPINIDVTTLFGTSKIEKKVEILFVPICKRCVKMQKKCNNMYFYSIISTALMVYPVFLFVSFISQRQSNVNADIVRIMNYFLAFPIFLLITWILFLGIFSLRVNKQYVPSRNFEVNLKQFHPISEAIVWGTNRKYFEKILKQNSTISKKEKSNQKEI